MNYFRVLVILILLAGITGVGFASPVQEKKQQEPDIESPWKEIIHELKVNQPVRMAAFLNESFGITGGMGGEGRTHYTEDGGATWSMSEGSGGCLYGLDIVDEQVIWVCGRMSGVSFNTPGGIRMSNDRGRNWGPTTNYNTLGGSSLVSFMDSITGWVYNKYTLIHTTDGGKNYTKVPLPDDSKGIVGMSYSQPGIGYILDKTFTLYKTANEGKDWVSSVIDCEGIDESRKILKLDDLATTCIRFSDEKNGIVVISFCCGEQASIEIFRTKDGGSTWNSENLPINIKIGVPYLSHDGKYLTIYNMTTFKIYAFRYQG